MPSSLARILAAFAPSRLLLIKSRRLRTPLIVVSGTGTSVGKTHFAEALLLAWGRKRRVAGLKPVETGVSGATPSDASRLRAASSFHVKHEGVTFTEPLSPHLAARRRRRPIPFEALQAWIREVRHRAEGLVIELPGGLFTPLSHDVYNVDFAADLDPDLVLLVVPDRLGALHDTVAAARAASTSRVRPGGIVLVAPERRDASTGTHVRELPRLTGIPVAAKVPRGPPEQLSKLPAMDLLIDAVTRTARQRDAS